MKIQAHDNRVVEELPLQYRRLRACVPASTKQYMQLRGHVDSPEDRAEAHGEADLPLPPIEVVRTPDGERVVAIARGSWVSANHQCCAEQQDASEQIRIDSQLLLASIAARQGVAV